MAKQQYILQATYRIKKATGSLFNVNKALSTYCLLTRHKPTHTYVHRQPAAAGGDGGNGGIGGRQV